jgi:hypothetical protein
MICAAVVGTDKWWAGNKTNGQRLNVQAFNISCSVLVWVVKRWGYPGGHAVEPIKDEAQTACI